MASPPLDAPGTSGPCSSAVSARTTRPGCTDCSVPRVCDERWQVRDSNPRRLCRLIYSQIPLAAWVTCQAAPAASVRPDRRRWIRIPAGAGNSEIRAGRGIATATLGIPGEHAGSGSTCACIRGSVASHRYGKEPRMLTLTDTANHTVDRLVEARRTRRPPDCASPSVTTSATASRSSRRPSRATWSWRARASTSTRSSPSRSPRPCWMRPRTGSSSSHGAPERRTAARRRPPGVSSFLLPVSFPEAARGVPLNARSSAQPAAAAYRSAAAATVFA